MHPQGNNPKALASFLTLFAILFFAGSVAAEDPGWTPKPGGLTMDIHGHVFVNGERIKRPGYEIGAFGSGGESDCRGRGKINPIFGEWGYH